MKKKGSRRSSSQLDPLLQKKCSSCAGGFQPLDSKQIHSYLTQLNTWEVQKGTIARDFTFQNYCETMAFVNAVAWIAHQEDHHPDITFGYKKCRIAFSTHAVKGLTENDFIAAAKVDNLIS